MRNSRGRFVSDNVGNTEDAVSVPYVPAGGIVRAVSWSWESGGWRVRVLELPGAVVERHSIKDYPPENRDIASSFIDQAFFDTDPT